MLNLMFEDGGKLIVTGFKYLHEAPYIAVRKVSEMLLIRGETAIKEPHIYYNFEGFYDKDFKRYIFSYLHKKGFKGCLFTELERTYFEMYVKDSSHIDKSIDECMKHAYDDPENLRIYIL